MTTKQTEPLKLKTMRLLTSIPISLLLLTLVFLSQFPVKSHSQQAYRGNRPDNCTSNISEGYKCNGPISCRSLIAFRSRFPYNDPVSIASLLGSEVSDIASINKVSQMEKFPTNKLIIVPVSCSCWGNNYLHFPSQPYIMQKGDYYFRIANDTFQNLTTCSYVTFQNGLYVKNDVHNLSVGTSLMIPVRCACVSTKQSGEGVGFLLVYVVALGDTIASIAKIFGVSEESIMKANLISAKDTIYPFTPLLLPLKYESCSVHPTFYCRVDDKGFPVKLVILSSKVSSSPLSLLLYLSIYLFSLNSNL